MLSRCRHFQAVDRLFRNAPNVQCALVIWGTFSCHGGRQCSRAARRRQIAVDILWYEMILLHSLSRKGGIVQMKMVRMLIQIPAPLKAKLDALRSQGYTAAGYIRSLLERVLNQNPMARKRDEAWKIK